MSTERFELIAPCHFGLEAVLKEKYWDLATRSARWRMVRLLFWQMPRNCRCQCFSAYHRAYSTEGCGSESRDI